MYKRHFIILAVCLLISPCLIAGEGGGRLHQVWDTDVLGSGCLKGGSYNMCLRQCEKCARDYFKKCKKAKVPNAGAGNPCGVAETITETSITSRCQTVCMQRAVDE